MNVRPVVRFGLVLFGGVVLVWIFGVGAGEGLLGKRQDRIAVDDTDRETAHVPGRGTSDETDVALTDAVIPVREELADQPGIVVRKYAIHIGRTESGGSKKMPAERVRIDIYNKKPLPEERLIARVRGDLGTLYFATAPDAAAGFRDAQINTMTIEKNVLVEYLDETGATVTTMKSERLDLAESSFEVPGYALIEQVGMTLEGEHLLYDKSSGSFSFERNVRVAGTRFGLPDPSGAAASKQEESDSSGAVGVDDPPVEKTITCDGRFTFVPAEDDGTKAARPDDDETIAKLGGGLLTFRDNVVGSQADSELRCNELEITLENGPPTEDGEAGALEVSNVLAKGLPSAPAILANPQGTLVGATLHLVKTDDGGQIVTLDGRPAIRDASFGGDAAGAGATRFDAGAKSRIVVRPRPVDPEADPAGDASSDPAAPDAVAATVLELRDDAFLETASAEEGKRFRIEGHAIDLEFLERSVAPPEGEPSDGAPEKEFRLEKLVGTGDARGVFAGGTFRGDVILAVPIELDDGTSNFDVTVSPNPVVTIVQAAADDGPETLITIESTDGRLKYTPASSADAPTRAVFHAASAPILLRVEEAGVVTTTLEAYRTVEIDLGGGEDALQSLVATGQVVFHSLDQGVSGTGDRLTLLPVADGKRKFLLSGSLATAKLDDEERGKRAVRARTIEFDPETGALHAKGEVEATVAGLAITGDSGPMGGEAPAGDAADPGVLHCREMTLTTRESDGATLLNAWGDVRFEEPARDLLATCDRLIYDESTGFARLFAGGTEPATVTRSTPTVEGSSPRTVGVSGPEIVLEQQSGVLTCPDRGIVTLVRPTPDGEGETRVVARSRGPVRYVEDRLVLQDDVVVGFEEDGAEVRALWCDVCTVFFRSKDAPPRDDSSETASDTAGLDRIVAEGRVHLEQTAPRALTAEGERLEWTLSEDDEVMFLSGTDPQCWVIGLLGDRNVRDEADWFRLRKNSDEVEAKNGRTVFIEATGGR